MSKYIIELGEEANMVQVINVTQNGTVYVNAKYVTELEELNSDYINEHYGDLQDTAYKRGVNDGSLDVKERVDGAYQRGFEDGKAVYDKGCVGCKFEGNGNDHSPCDYCCNGYSNQWQAKQTDDKIEVGDEVNWIGDCFIVTRIFQPHNMKEQCDWIDDDGCVYHDVLMDDLEKTGRHLDIASVLEDMRHD